MPKVVTKETTSMPARAITMADIAARVGVSKMTVSRALSRPAPVLVGGRGATKGLSATDALQQRILKACDEMGYVIDQTARTFSSKRSGFVAALIPGLNNSNFSETVHGLTMAVEADGLQLLLGYTGYELDAEERLLKTMLMRRPEGVVLTGSTHTESVRKMLKAAGIPVVQTWELPAQPIQHTVGFSNADAFAALVRHLHAKGYRKIGFIGSASTRDVRGIDRKMGYRRAMRSLGLSAVRVVDVGEPPISMAQGAQAVMQLVSRWPDVDAVVCASDLSAFGALMACQRQGWAVPQRLAIAGFGNFEVGRNSFPRITTVGVDCEGLGRRAGELLLRAIAAGRGGTPLSPQTVVVPFHVDEREST